MKRRTKGEGSIGWNARKQLWVAALTIGCDARGKQRRVYLYAKTKTGVAEKLNQLKGQRTTDAWVEPSKITLGTYMTRWLEDAKRSTIEPSTYGLYHGAMTKHVIPRIGGTRLPALTPGHLQGLLTTMEREGVGAGMREVIYRMLHAAFQQAVSWKMLPANPMTGVIKPRPPKREMQTLTAEQVARFLEEASQDRYHALYAILLSTGLRLGEALGLTWPDVDLKTGTLAIRRQLAQRTRLLKELKTSGSKRTVRMPGPVVEALRRHQERMRAENHEVTDHLLVFVNDAGHPVSQSNFRRRSFHRLLTKVGLTATNRQQGTLGIRLHDLRHSFATLGRRAGVDMLVISRSLGHSKPSTTWNIYSHVLPAMAEEDVKKLDVIFAPKPKAGADR